MQMWLCKITTTYNNKLNLLPQENHSQTTTNQTSCGFDHRLQLPSPWSDLAYSSRDHHPGSSGDPTQHSLRCSGQIWQKRQKRWQKGQKGKETQEEEGAEEEDYSGSWAESVGIKKERKTFHFGLTFESKSEVFQWFDPKIWVQMFIYSCCSD